ncbi:MAG: DNA polymerase III subunit beta [Oligosphaeraceae bacterium]|nr:DNA polymerase III subunit beta [Oligosphaeraceae bacterium]
MKLSITTENLLLALRRVMSVIGNNPANPILNNFLLEAADNKLFVTGLDNEICTKTEVAAMVFEAGKITLPGKKFYQIVSALPAGDVNLEISADDNELVNLSCRRASYKIRGLDAIDFPKVEDFTEEWSFNLPGKQLVSALMKVFYARSDDEARKVLHGVLLSIRAGMLTVAATDGRRLALVEKVISDQDIEERDSDVILPYKTVSELIKSLDASKDVKIRLSASKAVFETADTTITSKLSEGNYPNYRSVIPDDFNHMVAMSRLTFADVLNRVALVVSESSNSINLEIGVGQIKVWGKSAEYGEASEPFEASYEGEETNIAFNPDFIVEPLKHLECDQVIMKFNDNASPVAICGDEGFLYILMPMRN